jgi:hypothetical protein
VWASPYAATWPASIPPGGGTYRVLFRINGATREVIVLRIDHRRDAYRPH